MNGTDELATKILLRSASITKYCQVKN